MSFVQTRLSDAIYPPIATGIVNVPVTQTVTVVDLTSMNGSPGNQVNGLDVSQIGGRNPNPIDHYITIQADAGPVYVAFAGLATTLSTVTTVATSTISGTNQIPNGSTSNGMIVIPAGTERAWLLPPGMNPGPTSSQPWGGNSPARFVALMTNSATTATARMWQSSP